MKSLLHPRVLAGRYREKMRPTLRPHCVSAPWGLEGQRKWKFPTYQSGEWKRGKESSRVLLVLQSWIPITKYWLENEILLSYETHVWGSRAEFLTSKADQSFFFHLKIIFVPEWSIVIKTDKFFRYLFNSWIREDNVLPFVKYKRALSWVYKDIHKSAMPLATVTLFTRQHSKVGLTKDIFQ